MNFKPELAAKVMAGEKTVTRRLVSQNPRSPWFVDRCGLKVNHTYAVCPGRGKDAIGHVRIVSVDLVPLALIDEAEAVREGFDSLDEFWDAFDSINGRVDPGEWVWRIEFALFAREDAPLWEHAG